MKGDDLPANDEGRTGASALGEPETGLRVPAVPGAPLISGAERLVSVDLSSVPNLGRLSHSVDSFLAYSLNFCVLFQMRKPVRYF